MRVFLQRQMRVFIASIFACLMFVLPFAARADRTSCQACMTRCHADYPGDRIDVCFGACNLPAVGQPCQGVSIGEVSSGFGSAESGSGHRSSRVQGTTTNPSGATTQPTTPAGNCVDTAVRAGRVTAEEASTVVGRSGRASTDFACQRTCTEAQQGNCLRGGCPGTEAAVLCCPPGGGIAIGERCGARGTAGSDAAAGGQDGGATSGGSETSGTDAPASSPAGSAGTGGATSANTPQSSSGSSRSSGGGSGRLSLPSCIESGNCQVSDLLDTGLNAIRFMFGLAGALLLVVFVYAGVEYLLADTFGSVKSAKERLQKAVSGIAIMFFGYTLVKFLVNLLVR